MIYMNFIIKDVTVVHVTINFALVSDSRCIMFSLKNNYEY